MHLHSPMKSLTCLGILLLAALAAQDTVIPLVKPPMKMTFTLETSATKDDQFTAPSECALLDSCENLAKCRKALGTQLSKGIHYTLKAEESAASDFLIDGKFPGLTVSENSTFCDIPFQVEEFRFTGLKGCGAKLNYHVKEIPKGTLKTSTTDRIFGTAFSRSATGLIVPVGSLLPAAMAYYVELRDQCLPPPSGTTKYKAIVAWSATFGTDNNQGAIPNLGKVVNMTLETTPECVRSTKLNEALAAKDMVNVQLAVTEVVDLATKNPECLARLTARLSVSSAPQKLSLGTDKRLSTDGKRVSTDVFGFRLSPMVPKSMRLSLVAIQFESNLKCNEVPRIYFVPKASGKLLAMDALQMSSPNRLELSLPIAPSDEDMFVFLSGCAPQDKLVAEFVLVPSADPAEIPLIGSLLTPPVVSNVLPTISSRDKCPAVACVQGRNLDECLDATTKDKKCKVYLNWKGDSAITTTVVERIDEVQLGMGIGFAMALRGNENISNWVSPGFALSSTKKLSIPPNLPVRCDFKSSHVVVGKTTTSSKSSTSEVTFDEPFPLSEGAMRCFLPVPMSVEEAKALKIVWNVTGVLEAVDDARNQIPVMLEASELHGCPLVPLPDRFFAQTALEKFKKDHLAGCKGVEIVSMMSARGYKTSSFKNKNFPVVKLDPKLLPDGNESWNLTAWAVQGVDPATCYVKDSVLSLVTEDSTTGELTKGETVFTIATLQPHRIRLIFKPPIILNKENVVLLAFLSDGCATQNEIVHTSISISRPFEVKDTTTPKPVSTGHTVATGPSTASFSPLQLVPLVTSLFFVFA